MRIVDKVDILNCASAGVSESQRAALRMVDKLCLADNLVKAAILASSALEDDDQRNAFAALFSCIEEKIEDCTNDLRSSFVNSEGD